jgi:hypothetical protein
MWEKKNKSDAKRDERGVNDGLQSKAKVVKTTGMIESKGNETITPKIPISQGPVSCVSLHVAVLHAALAYATTHHCLRAFHQLDHGDPPIVHDRIRSAQVP